MRKRIGLLLGFLFLMILIVAGVRNIGNDSFSIEDQGASPEPSSIVEHPTASSSSFAEDMGFIEGYYWDGYLDQREKFQDSVQEKEYKDVLMSSQIPNTPEGSDYLWYRLENVPEEIPDGSYVKVTYQGSILEVYPEIFLRF